MQRSNQNYIVAHLQNGKIENSSGTNERKKKNWWLHLNWYQAKCNGHRVDALNIFGSNFEALIPASNMCIVCAMSECKQSRNAFAMWTKDMNKSNAYSNKKLIILYFIWVFICASKSPHKTTQQFSMNLYFLDGTRFAAFEWLPTTT